MIKTLVSAFGFIFLMLAAVAFAAPVPDTGQTRCYNDTAEITCTSSGQLFYGQDAQYTINPMSYTKLDVNGNPLSSSATAWSMVKDNVTGLVWEMKTNMDGLPDYSNLHDADNTYTWYDSNNSFIKALNDANYGGYNDWRMPTINELAYIVNYSVPYPGPTIDTGYFPNTAESWNYWSSTTQADNTNIAWYMNFGYGRNSIDYKSKYKYVRAVREEGQPPTYADNGDGTVTDTLTGLIWQQKSSSSTYSWEQALVYCEGLNLAGYTDWRIPTIKELTSLVDYSRRAPAIDTTFFPDTKATQLYWSSTTYFNYTYGAWYVNFNTGNSIHCNKDNDNYVRAVRGQVCTSILDGNYSLFIPVLSYLDPSLGQQLCWAYFVYEYNPMYPTLLIFKWTDSGVLIPPFLCAALTLSEYLRIHIPDVLLPDGITHGHMDLEYSPAFSTAQNAYFIVTAPWF